MNDIRTEIQFIMDELGIALESLGETSPEQWKVFDALLDAHLDYYEVKRKEDGNIDVFDILDASKKGRGNYALTLVTDFLLYVTEIDNIILFMMTETRNEILDRVTEEQIKERARDPKRALEAKESGEEISLHDFLLFFGLRFAVDLLKSLPRTTRRKLRKFKITGSEQPLAEVLNSSAVMKLSNIFAGDGRDLMSTKAYTEISTERIRRQTPSGELLPIVDIYTTYLNTKTKESIIIKVSVPYEEEEEGKSGPKPLKSKARLVDMFFQAMLYQHYPREVELYFDDYVEYGIFTNRKYAIEGLQSFAKWFADTSPSCSLYAPPKGKKYKGREIAGDNLVTGWKKIPGGVVIKVNQDAAIFEIYAEFIGLFPRFGYGLSDTAYLILRYIFYIARQKTQYIDKEKNTLIFNISLDSIRGAAGISPPEEVKNRKYAERIKRPISNALEEIRGQLKKERMLKHDSLELKILDEDESNIRQWLAGNLQITIREDIVKAYKDHGMIRKRRRLEDTSPEEEKSKNENAQAEIIVDGE